MFVNAVSATTWSVNAHWTGSPTMKWESMLSACRVPGSLRERRRAEVPAGRVGHVLRVPARERHLHAGVADLVDELDVVAVAQLVVGDRVDQHRHAAARADLGVRGRDDVRLDDLQPALAGLARHLRAHRRVVPAVDALVLLQLHRQVLPHDVLHRVLRLGRELVARRVLVRRLEVVGLPAELRDALVGLGDAAAAGGRGAHGTSSSAELGVARPRRERYRLTDARVNNDSRMPDDTASADRPSGAGARPSRPSARSSTRPRRSCASGPFRDLTVDEVMARTTLSRPSFYVYFRDRHHLAVRLVEGIGERAVRAWRTAGWRARGDPREDVREALSGRRGGVRRARAGAARDRGRRRATTPRSSAIYHGLIERFVAATATRIEARDRDRAASQPLDPRATAARARVDERALPADDARPPAAGRRSTRSSRRSRRSGYARSTQTHVVHTHATRPAPRCGGATDRCYAIRSSYPRTAMWRWQSSRRGSTAS